jgi:hypothetical protein
LAPTKSLQTIEIWFISMEKNIERKNDVLRFDNKNQQGVHHNQSN